jgi:Flp pilus assembly protein TadB
MDQQLAQLKKIEAELAESKAREAEILARLDEIEEVKFGKEHPILNKPVVAIPLAFVVAAVASVLAYLNAPHLTLMWVVMFVILVPVLIWRFMTIRGPLVRPMNAAELFSSHNSGNSPFL